MKMSDLLIRSLDEELSAAEQEQLNRALAVSEELRLEREQLLRLRAALASLQPEPMPDFADRVKARLDDATSLTVAIVRLFPRVAAACVLVLLFVLLAVYLSEGNLSTEAIIGTQELTVEDAYALVN